MSQAKIQSSEIISEFNCVNAIDNEEFDKIVSECREYNIPLEMKGIKMATFSEFSGTIMGLRCPNFILNPNATVCSKNLSTALHVASYVGDIPLIKFLLNKGALFATQSCSEAPPQLNKYHITKEVKDYLLTIEGHGRRVSEYLWSENYLKNPKAYEISSGFNYSLLHIAVFEGDKDIIDFYFQKEKEMICDINGNLPTHEYEWFKRLDNDKLEKIYDTLKYLKLKLRKLA